MFKRVSIILIILMFVNIASAAPANNSSLLSPGMGMAWFWQQPTDFQNAIFWLVGLVMFIVGASLIVSSGILISRSAVEHSGFSNPEQKSKTNSGILGIIVTVVAMVIILRLALSFFQWF